LDDDDNCVLFALDASTGAIKWKTKLDGAVSPSSPAVAPDGTIWVGDMTTMYAIQGASPLDPNSPWPMYHHDAAHTGQQNAGTYPAVQGLTAVPSFRTISLNWTPTPGATSYTVKRASAGSSAFTTLATGVTGTSYVDGADINNNTLQGFSSYYYVVESQHGTASGSRPVLATTLPIVVNVKLGSMPQRTGRAAARVGDVNDFWNLDLTLDPQNLYDRTQVLTGDTQPPAPPPVQVTWEGTCGYGNCIPWGVTTALYGSGDDPLFQGSATAQENPFYVHIGPLPPGSYDLFIYGIWTDEGGAGWFRYNSGFGLPYGTLGYSGVGVPWIDGNISDPEKFTSPDFTWDINQFVEGNQYVKFKYLQPL
jgi:hypothetical protein